MKILAIGDVHGDTDLIKKLAEDAKNENVDLVILAGDMTLGERSLKGIIGPFAKEKKQVLLVPGNHESIATIDFLSKSYDNAKNLHGYGFVINGVGIFGAGTANMGIHQIGDENIFRALEKGYREVQGSKKKVMVTHIPPEGSKAEMFGWTGSKAVKKAIERFKPDIAVDAHIHEAGGLQEKILDTMVFNVSRKARIFEI